MNVQCCTPFGLAAAMCGVTGLLGGFGINMLRWTLTLGKIKTVCCPLLPNPPTPQCLEWMGPDFLSQYTFSHLCGVADELKSSGVAGTSFFLILAGAVAVAGIGGAVYFLRSERGVEWRQRLHDMYIRKCTYEPLQDQVQLAQK